MQNLGKKESPTPAEPTPRGGARGGHGGAPPHTENLKKKRQDLQNRSTDTLSADNDEKKPLDPAKPAPRGPVRGVLSGGSPSQEVKNGLSVKKDLS